MRFWKLLGAVCALAEVLRVVLLSLRLVPIRRRSPRAGVMERRHTTGEERSDEEPRQPERHCLHLLHDTHLEFAVRGIARCHYPRFGRAETWHAPEILGRSGPDAHSL